MHRLHLLRWVALVVAALCFQCAELSKDCRNTLTCEPAPTLGSDCVWRYPDGGIWTEGPQRTPEGLWQWPNGRQTRTQTLVCPPGDAGLDGGVGPIFVGDCPRVACDAPLLCDTPSGLCVQCLSGNDCVEAVSSTGTPLPVCDPRSHACVACRSDGDCAGGLHCKSDPDPRRNRCVECVSGAHCGNGEVCDGTSNECTSTCTRPGQCDPPKPICSNLATGASTGLCVECLDNSQCSGSTPQCNTARKECVACVDDTVCGGRVCSADNRCVECVDDTRCGTEAAPNCDLQSNTCVQCLNSSQCTAPDKSKCNAVSHVCEPCTDNIQCEGALSVCSAGRCVACSDDSTCTNPLAPHCDTGTGTCVACINDSQCTLAPAARCDTNTHTCAPCTSPTQCAGKFGPKDLCRMADGECVQCESNGDCTEDPAASRCNAATGLCSRCQVDGDCNALAGLRACSGGANAACVECTSDAFCTTNPDGRACNTATNTCVECVTDAHCTSPGASRCSNNQCVPCVNDAGGSHCGHVLNGTTVLGVCDVSAGPAAGVCVQCTGRDRAACGANVCYSQDRVCSPFLARSAPLCGDCVSDDHCAVNQRCVLEQFDGTSLGTYSCFPVDQAGDCPQTPFSGETTLTTIDGFSEAMCMLRRTTCEGFNEAGNLPCTVNADCGDAALDDGRCDLLSLTCSIPCNSSIDCPNPENESCLGGICQL